MTLNCPIDQRAHPYAVPGEHFILFRRDMEFYVKIDNFGKKSAVGMTYLTTFRIIMVPTQRTQDFFSFDLPIANITKEDVEFPLLGCTYIKGVCRPYNNLLPGNTNFKLTFKKGGCDTFIRIFSALLKETRNRMSQRMMFQNSQMYQDIRNGRFNFNALVNPNDPSTIYTSQPVFHSPVKSNSQSQSQPIKPQNTQPYFQQPQKPIPQKVQAKQPVKIQQKEQETTKTKTQDLLGLYSQIKQQEKVNPYYIEQKQKLQIQINQPKIQQVPIIIKQNHNIHESTHYAEICSFAYFINRVFKYFQVNYQQKHESLKINGFKPLNPQTFCSRLSDGIIFCQFINIASVISQNDELVYPISPLAINFQVQTLSNRLQNIKLSFNTAKSLGAYTQTITPEQLLQQEQKQVLSFCWELIQIYISNYLTIKRYPELYLIFSKQPGYDKNKDYLDKKSFRQILMLWINYHKNCYRSVDILVNKFDVGLVRQYLCVLVGMKEGELMQIEEYQQKSQIQQAKYIGQVCKNWKIDTPIHYTDLLTNKQHMHIIFCYDLFLHNNGLNLPTNFQLPTCLTIPFKQKQAKTLKNRQLKMFNNWISSLGLKSSNPNIDSLDLISKLKDGEILLKVIDKLRPGLVDWKGKFSEKYTSRVHIIQNCNYVVELCTKNLGIKFVNVQGMDIVDGQVNLVLGVVWQLCNVYEEERVGHLKTEELLRWANSLVPENVRVKSLQDKLIATGVYLIYLIHGINPSAIDISKVRIPDTEQAICSNINYSLGCARKLGAQILGLWEHVRQTQTRFIKLILGELRVISSQQVEK